VEVVVCAVGVVDEGLAFLEGKPGFGEDTV
jgi:hypothetical protein